MRQECRNSKNVASRSCDWLLIVLAMRARGASLTKTDGKINEESLLLIYHLGMGQKLPNIHCLVDNTLTMYESHLTKTYLKIFGASSCTCIGIAKCLRYNWGSFTKFLGKYLVIFGNGKWAWGIIVVSWVETMVSKEHGVHNWIQKSNCICNCYPKLNNLSWVGNINLLCQYNHGE